MSTQATAAATASGASPAGAERSLQPERSAKREATSRGGGVPAAVIEERGED
jgi:hypothetical protein